MSDLAAFLLARIAEDEAAIGRHVAGVARENRTLWQPRWSVTRLIAECEAKRRIVERWQQTADRLQVDMEQTQGGWTLALLAVPYADHADYDPEWKP